MPTRAFEPEARRPLPGRPRDAAIDRRILDAARRHLAQHGYDGMSLRAVAEDAGTTRQALYRRWPSKADLATAAIAAIAAADEPAPTDDPFADLVRELRAFRIGIGRPDGISMVGTMLLDATDPDLVERYRARIVAPRRRRLRAILERAVTDGRLGPDPDLEVAVTFMTGSWYARVLAGDPEPRHWDERVARLVWRSLGGVVPDP